MNILKKLIALLLCPLLLLALCACGATEPAPTATTEPQATIDPNTPLCDGKTLKILAITSSFGLNTTQILPDVALAQGATEVIVGRLYASGCTLQEHVEFAKTGTPGYKYTKNVNGQWTTVENATFLYGLQDEDWDIIFTQQSAAYSPIISSYQNYIDQLMEYVQANKTNPNARFVWNMTWAYQGDSIQAVFANTFHGDQMAMYNAILSCVEEKVIPRTDFQAIIPTGTAIQNARTSYFGDTLTKDTYHLNNLGRIIAGYTVWAILTGEPLTEIKLESASSYDLPEPALLSESDKAVIIECVNNAIANPYEVTPSSYPTKPE